MRIIPAIDIIEGKCVRLTRGDYNTKKVYNEDPVEAAKAFEDSGIQYLHVVDLDGAKSNKIINYRILEKICTQTKLKVDFGGGLKADEDVVIAFNSGASQITGGSIAVKDKDLFLSWLESYGAEKIILGADFLNRKIATNGWLQASDMDLITFISGFQKAGVAYCICTDIDKDGMLQGPSTGIYKEILQTTAVKLIASGGITTLQDLHTLKALGCEGAIVGKAIYEGHITLKSLAALC